MDEKPIPNDTNWFVRRFQVPYEQVETILVEFFDLQEDGWHHGRCDLEIQRFKELIAIASKAGKASAAKRASKKETSTPVQHEDNDISTPVQRPFNQPITNNQEPLTIRKTKAESVTATRLPADWEMSDAEYQFCLTERPDLKPTDVAERFRDYWKGVGGAKGKKVDWMATWRNWVRNERGGRQNGKQTRLDKLGQCAAELTGSVRSEGFNSRVIEGTATEVD